MNENYHGTYTMCESSFIMRTISSQAVPFHRKSLTAQTQIEFVIFGVSSFLLRLLDVREVAIIPR